ncbi:hypothetical protein ABI59_03860 [Acidobacteria bacterium Mor1]|nr:hypothetical protein ABI59_03860 [Acidobacteria bacterium Mor1]
MTAWRVLRDGPGSAARNMAVDEAILESYVCGRLHEPTLRLYGWSRPALTLGKHQDPAEVLEPAARQRQGVDWQRRPTGGRVVLHEGERTFSLAGRLDDPRSGGSVKQVYAASTAALRTTFELLGLEVDPAPAADPLHCRPSGSAACFAQAAPHELTTGRRKFVGVAQLRRRGAFLQQGSIPRVVSAEGFRRWTGEPVDPAAFVGIETVLGREVSDDEIDDALCRGFSRALDIRLLPGCLTPEEREFSERREARRRYGTA